MSKGADSAYKILIFECRVSSAIEKPGIEDQVLESMELDHFVKSALPFLKGPGRKPGIRVQETFGKVFHLDLFSRSQEEVC